MSVIPRYLIDNKEDLRMDRTSQKTSTDAFIPPTLPPPRFKPVDLDLGRIPSLDYVGYSPPPPLPLARFYATYPRVRRHRLSILS